MGSSSLSSISVIRTSSNSASGKTANPSWNSSSMSSIGSLSSSLSNAARLDSEIIYDRDFDYDYFGFKTLERSYLLKVQGKVVERPQHMLMRVAVGIHKDDIESIIKTHHLMSQRWFTHTSPTLFNAGTPRPRHVNFEQLFPVIFVELMEHPMALFQCCVSSMILLDMLIKEVARGKVLCRVSRANADIYEFLILRKNHGKEEHRARDLFYALWIPDLFMERVQNNGEWFLSCPNEAPCLADCWGQKFENLYIQYEREGKAKKVVQAQTLCFEVLKSQIETGTPYMLFKDTCNRKSNQQNLGTIKSSNLCTVIIEYTSPTETAVCNLASIALPQYVREKGVPVESQPSKLDSCELVDLGASQLATKEGPMRHILEVQLARELFNQMWGVTPSNRWDWNALRQMIANYGVRNSLLIAPMPTASTSQILGNNECFEPYTSNIYSRRVLSGEFVVVNKHLHDLTEMGLWSPTLKNRIIYEDGSVQKMLEIPDDQRAIYKTVWEIKQKTLVDMAVDRRCYIDQSQSLNIHMDQPNFGKLTSLYFYTWSKGFENGDVLSTNSCCS